MFLPVSWDIAKSNFFSAFRIWASLTSPLLPLWVFCSPSLSLPVSHWEMSSSSQTHSTPRVQCERTSLKFIFHISSYLLIRVTILPGGERVRAQTQHWETHLLPLPPTPLKGATQPWSAQEHIHQFPCSTLEPRQLPHSWVLLLFTSAYFSLVPLCHCFSTAFLWPLNSFIFIPASWSIYPYLSQISLPKVLPLTLHFPDQNPPVTIHSLWVKDKFFNIV